MIFDKLFKNVEKKGYVCLGLDTSIAYVPEQFSDKFNNISDTLFNFNKKIIDATFDVVACYKIQIAYYESYGLQGLEAYKKTLKYIKSIGQISIADIKRGDIKETAAMYAKAHFTGDFESDIITLNPYMGMDSLEPYEEYFDTKGCFVLVRTSNIGSHDIQYLKTEEQKRVFETVGEKIQALGSKYIGKSGYSAIGAVIGATNATEGLALREMLSTTFMLIPGFGAQGGTADDVALYLKNGNGGVANSSRAILTKYKNYQDGQQKFDTYAREEAISMNGLIKSKVVK